MYSSTNSVAKWRHKISALFQKFIFHQKVIFRSKMVINVELKNSQQMHLITFPTSLQILPLYKVFHTHTGYT